MLVSYSGRSRADVDFTKARAVQFKAWQKAANAAVKAKEEKPPRPDNLRVDTLYLTPGSTAMVTKEELAVIRVDRKDVAKFLQVHEGAPEVPRSLRPKGEAEAEAESEGSSDGGDSGDGGGEGGEDGDSTTKPATAKPVKPTRKKRG